MSLKEKPIYQRDAINILKYKLFTTDSSVKLGKLMYFGHIIHNEFLEKDISKQERSIKKRRKAIEHMGTGHKRLAWYSNNMDEQDGTRSSVV